MSSSSSSSKPRLRLHVDTTTTTTTTGSAASPGSGSTSHSPRAAAASGSGHQNQACAACKYQRRKCAPDCPLAPYFPADQQRRFLNAHRLFGVKKIQKTLRGIDPERGPDAMRALIFQSDARAADPVGGCVTIIEQLQRQIERTELELAYVRQQIAIYRQAAAPPLTDNNPAMILPAGAQDNAVAAMDALYAAGQEPAVPGGGGGVVFQDQQGYHHVLKVGDQQKHPQQQLYNYFGYDGTTAGDEATSSSHGHDGRVVHQEHYNFANTNNVRIGSSPMELGEQLEQQCQIDQAAPFVDAFDVKPHGRMEHHGPAGVVRRQEKMGAMLNHDVDQQMEEDPATTAAPCHLELGFSSF